MVGHTSPIYCRYLPSGQAGSKLYCLVTEAHVVREQLAQGCYLMVEWLGVKPVTLRSLVRHTNHYITKPYHTECDMSSITLCGIQLSEACCQHTYCHDELVYSLSQAGHATVLYFDLPRQSPENCFLVTIGYSYLNY